MWTFVHLICKSPIARLRLIAERFPPVGQQRRWFFVDVPLTGVDRASYGLEVGLQESSGDRSVDHEIHSFLETAHREGLIKEAEIATASFVLVPKLFLQEFIPTSFVNALAIGSLRATDILRTIYSIGASRASWGMVHDEFATIYRELIPNPNQRLMALDWHATWLKEFAAHTSNESESDLAAKQDKTGIHVSIEPIHRYLRISKVLTREIEAMVEQLEKAQIASRPTANVLRATVVARLAHIQAVRLWGPDYSNEPHYEGLILRQLTESRTVSAYPKESS